MPDRWTAANIRHAIGTLRYGAKPAATVYDSIGEDFFLALAPGWLNLGLWEGDGSDPSEAPLAVRRLVATLAEELPTGGDVLDVGNGLGAQDPEIARIATPASLTALNITLSQLRAGAASLAAAEARAVNADATRLPFRDGSFDGLISVEAAFHFPSRARFFTEAHRVLRPGGVLTMSDIPTLRFPRGPRELLAAVTQLRVWGLRTGAAASPTDIVRLVERAGFADVRTELVGDRVIAPALRFVRRRLETGEHDGPSGQAAAARWLLRQVEILWDEGLLEYLLLRASKAA
ncbi:MAG TPA: methyltransferase domain-containing protein [Actinomycetota bacterium]|nr:methyltransferase domain-containing protein [Actinomycetota bacterium]